MSKLHPGFNVTFFFALVFSYDKFVRADKAGWMNKRGNYLLSNSNRIAIVFTLSVSVGQKSSPRHVVK